MNAQELENAILEVYDNKDADPTSDQLIALKEVNKKIMSGELHAVEQDQEGDWHVQEWVKKAILLNFRVNQCALVSGGPDGHDWYDKVPMQFDQYTQECFAIRKIRVVPGAIVRSPAYIGESVVLMPSFVNVGAYIGANTMIDTWSTVGSCARVGKNCHISGGVGIGGVIEPLQASPVIIEDNCFIGARSEIAEGVLVKKGAVIAMGVYLSQSTKIVNRTTGEISYGVIPENAVVIPGSLSTTREGLSTYCVIIIKFADHKTRSKTSINELLRS